MLLVSNDATYFTRDPFTFTIIIIITITTTTSSWQEAPMVD